MVRPARLGQRPRTARDLAPHFAAVPAQAAHAIDPQGARANVARIDVIEIVACGLTIGIEDARLATLKDLDLAGAQSVGGR